MMKQGKVTRFLLHNRELKEAYTKHMKAQPVISGMTVMFIYSIMLLGIGGVGIAASMYLGSLEGIAVSSICLIAGSLVMWQMGTLGEKFGNWGYKMEAVDEEPEE